jgi:hypothetical protein
MKRNAEIGLFTKSSKTVGGDNPSPGNRFRALALSSRLAPSSYISLEVRIELQTELFLITQGLRKSRGSIIDLPYPLARNNIDQKRYALMPHTANH